MFRLASILVVAYLIIAIVSLGSLRVDYVAWYSVVLVTFGVITYTVGVLCWITGPVLLVLSGIAYRADASRARHVLAKRTAQNHVRQHIC
jgi:hypothetical protein